MISTTDTTLAVIENRSVLSRGLPKWPQMRVEGVPVTIEQAKEIIRRTDSYFCWPDHFGNDRAYCQRVMAKLGIPSMNRKPNYEYQPGEIGEMFAQQDVWRKEWGYINTHYVHNSWIASSFIYGPHGWCHPDGAIHYIDNIGKWPDSETVLEDWAMLAREFPFLNLIAVLMDREECEEGGEPVVGYYVNNGKVVVFDPNQIIAGGSLSNSIKLQRDNTDKLVIYDEGAEHGIPWSWILDWADRPRSTRQIA